MLFLLSDERVKAGETIILSSCRTLRRANDKRGFTIVELVVVIAVIAILAAVLIPTFSGIIARADESSARQEATNALKAYLVEYPNIKSVVEDDDTYYVSYYKVNKGSYCYFYRCTSERALEQITVDEWPSFSEYLSVEVYVANPADRDIAELGSAKLTIYKKFLSDTTAIYYAESASDTFTEIRMQFSTDRYYACENDYYILTCLSDIEFGEPEPSADDPTVFIDSNGIEYKSLGNRTAKVISYTGSASSITILPYLSNGDKVVSIERHAFSGKSTLKTVIVSEGIKTLASCSFYNCKNLQSIQLPSSLETIGYYSFKYCSSLKSIVLPVNCTIDEGSFTTIVDFSFAGDNSIETARYKIAGGCLIDKNTGTLVAYYDTDNNAEIPEGLGITKIGDRVFACASIETITIPSSVKTIGIESFYYCSKLKTIQNNAAIESIGASCFCECSQLTSFTIPKTLTTLGTCAFNGCGNLDIILEIDFEEQVYVGVKSITLSSTENNYHCKNGCIIRNDDNVVVAAAMSNADIPADESITILGARAFSYCALPADVVIPDNIKEIGVRCFFGCTGVEKLTIKANVHTLKEYCFGYVRGLKEIVLESSIAYLPVGFCSSCSDLTTISLPGSITTISAKALADCKSLTTIYFAGTIAAWKSIDFANDWHSGTASFTVVCTDGDIGYMG